MLVVFSRSGDKFKRTEYVLLPFSTLRVEDGSRHNAGDIALAFKRNVATVPERAEFGNRQFAEFLIVQAEVIARSSSD